FPVQKPLQAITFTSTVPPLWHNCQSYSGNFFSNYLPVISGILLMVFEADTGN
ncbi:hypothetical protein WG66_003888, partial [Moniliophthora roreri]